MKNSSWIISLLIGFLLFPACEKSTDPMSVAKDTPISEENVYFYLSDSAGSEKTEFLEGEDIFFHFGVINSKRLPLNYTKGHGGPPIVSFVIFQNDSMIGYSDDGYAYTAEVVFSKILPNDTLEHSASWYSNPHHTDLLEKGSYYSTIHTYIWFDDFDLASLLDTVYFEIK